MVRSGRHRLPKPTTLLVLVAVLLVGSGVAAAVGTASADPGSRSSRASASKSDGSRDRDHGDRRGDGDSGRQDGDSRRGDRDRDGDDGRKNDSKNDNDDDNKNDSDKKDNKDDEEFPGRDEAAPADPRDFVDIRTVRPDRDDPSNDSDASTGTFVAHCGTNTNNHRNSDNFIATPGKHNGAQHIHDYVGNLSTDAFSTNRSLHAAGTTCDRDNLSTFYWPVLRATNERGDDAGSDGGGLDGNFGAILRPTSVDLRFRGNPTSKVEPMPDDLRMTMGDAKAKTDGPDKAHAQWTCTGFENRITDMYPLCPAGSNLVRILDFPSCWDGKHLDSKDHQSHVIFPREDGSCRRGFVAIPQLRVTLTFNRPDGRNFALDTFPDQQHDPRTDHSDFENIASDSLLDFAAKCINSGKHC